MCDFDVFCFFVDFNFDLVVFVDWFIKLRNLICFWVVWIEIVFVVKFCICCDFIVECYSGFYCKFNCFFV